MKKVDGCGQLLIFFTSEWHKVILLTFIFMQDLINISVR